MAAKRKYPVGIQSFSDIRSKGFLYVDKTELIYKMITEGKPYFLSRPRRFGKSLLVSTLAAVFEGRRELFEEMTLKDGTVQPRLFIATTDLEWERHPVLRFDFSAGDLDTIEQLDRLINATLADYERRFGITPVDQDTNLRMINLIRTAHEQTGQQVVVLCDEYDSMMLHSIGDPVKQRAVRQRFQNLFGPLKSEDEHLRLVFITGISKFSQMGVFSRLNQMRNISMDPAYDALCGISESELTTTLRPDIEQMAECSGVDYDKMLALLKQNYDGYHFSSGMTDIYNPFSLFSAFSSGLLSDYWFSSGTTRALIDMLTQMPRIDLTSVSHVECDSSAFDRPFDTFSAPLPVLYQSGYLTIKDYDREIDAFTLGLPNNEVQRGFAASLYASITHSDDCDDPERNGLKVVPTSC